MKSFEIHFDNKGNVLVDNINGVDNNTDECVNVTKPYVDNFGVVVDSIMLNNNQIMNQTTEQKEIL